MGNNYIKKNDFEIYIDNALISYSKEYQFSYPGIHNISIILYEENISMEKMFQGINSIVSVELNTDKNNIFISSIKEAFDECKNLISFSLNGFNTSKIKSFHKLFHLAQIKNIDLSKFEAKELEDISYMLSGTPIEEIELKNINTGKLVNMSHLFDGCTSLYKIKFDNFDTSKVIDM